MGRASWGCASPPRKGLNATATGQVWIDKHHVRTGGAEQRLGPVGITDRQDFVTLRHQHSAQQLLQTNIRVGNNDTHTAPRLTGLRLTAGPLTDPGVAIHHTDAVLPALVRALDASGLGYAVLDQGGQTTRVSWFVVDQSPEVLSGPAWVDQARTLCRAAVPGGGLVGWLAYEAGRWCERMPAPTQRAPLPEVYLAQVAGFVDIGPSGVQVQGSPDFVAEAARFVGLATHRQPLDDRTEPSPAAPLSPDPQKAHRYTRAVQLALDEIFAGECYQVNLSWERTDVPCPSPVDAWLSLRRSNPAAWGALVHTRHGTIVSNSPELYLQVMHGRAESRPIKGTAPRASGEQGRRELTESIKERAELTMIVDLVRNDLGRVAVTGSVVAGPRHVRACGDLWHAEQTVAATLLPQHDVFDAVAATFPPGSVTGAPKVRAMELIAALEDGPRGVYTGAIGWFDQSGDAALNVAIRTATVQQGLARFHLGAGIVADSVPDAEWAETCAKGIQLHRQLSVRPQ